MGKKAVSQEIRWHIVGLSKVEKIKLKTIAEMVGVSEKCVRTTLKNFRETGSAKEKTEQDVHKLPQTAKSLTFQGLFLKKVD